ncbi:MAG: pirin family protein [Bacteroidetes bacterium]|nr:pirin family protein [Bacteroidota bacterium]
MTTRTLAHTETATNEKVGILKIKNVLPTRSLKQIDPFLLIHHMQPYHLKPGDDVRIPPHPHAGFEVMTYLLDGEFFHRDSKGHDQQAQAGDVNWMSSGSGLLHSEGPAGALVREGGKVQLLQIWINVPSQQKTRDASFTHYPAAGFPVINTDGYEVKLVLGGMGDKQSPIHTQTPMFLYHYKLKAGVSVTVPVKDTDSAAVYVLNGKLKILNETVDAGQLANTEQNGDQLVFTAVEDTEVVVFGGEPIKEKVVSYGPFVMNSFPEIQEAIARYESGKMGVLDY